MKQLQRLQKSDKTLAERLQDIISGTNKETESQFIDDAVFMARQGNTEAQSCLTEFKAFAIHRWMETQPKQC